MSDSHIESDVELVVPVKPLKRSRLVDEVTDQLRELILTNKLPPGSRLLQLEMAKRLGVSRTPLREAFRILEREGLVEISDGNNTIEVVDFTPDEIREMYEIREVIDGLAARLAATSELPRDLDRKLTVACETMQRTVGHRFQPAPFYDAHAEFHTSIVAASGNSRLIHLMPLFTLSIPMLASRIGSADQLAPASLQQVLAEANADHWSIYEAIRRGDPQSAESAARRHIQKSMNSWLINFDTTAKTANSDAVPGASSSSKGGTGRPDSDQTR